MNAISLVLEINFCLFRYRFYFFDIVWYDGMFLFYDRFKNKYFIIFAHYFLR